MKNLLITSAVLAMLSAPAMAVELGKGVSLNTTIDATYAVESEDFALIYTPELSYTIADGLTTYLNTDFDLQDPAFTGGLFGVVYTPAKFNKITLSAEASFDADLNYTDTVIEAKLKF